MMSPPSSTGNPLRLLIVDDSAIIRGMLHRKLSEQLDFVVEATATDGLMALNELRARRVDVVILDLEMPRMDGFTALPEIRRLAPGTKVLISSTLSERNADIALKALAMGADEYVAKPSARKSKEDSDAYYAEMVEKIRAISGRPAPALPIAAAPAPLPPAVSARATPSSEHADGHASAVSALLPSMRPQALAIASSTGGPQALLQIFTEVKKGLASVPIFITQHMPPTFTGILAKHIEQASGADCREGVDGELIEKGRVYIAPGDFHMRVRRDGDAIRIRLDQEAPVNYCRPAADPMIESLAKVYGNRLMLLVLTGMGQDGMVGARQVMEEGGTVVAQDKASCIVWGMPKAVAERGYCKGLLPLSQFAPYLLQVFGGGR